MLVNLNEILSDAEKHQYGIPCINTPNVETVRAVIGAAEELNTPIIIDHAQVHDSLIPIESIGPVMVEYAKKASVPVCVHLDHAKDINFIVRAIKVGFSSIMYDCSHLPYDENLERVKQVVQVAHELGITVEAELGVMASTEEDTHVDEDTVITNEDIEKFYTNPDRAAAFAKESGCDALAVCFGTMHGIYAETPRLDIDRVRAIREKVPNNCRIVMHGASGVPMAQLQEAIKAGCSKINYYSYMAKSTTKFVKELIEKNQGKILYHEVQEATVGFMKDYVKKLLLDFKNSSR